MTQEELQALIDEGKTLDEILALRGESAEELLEEKSSVVVPLDALKDALLDEYTLSQYQGLVKTIINFSLGNYEYKPDEKIPNSMRSNLKRFIGDNNEKYLLKHVNQSIKGARGGRPRKSKALKPEDFDEKPQEDTETYGFQKTSTQVGETPKIEAKESNGFLPKALYDYAYAKENVNENFCSSSKDNKGVGEEEKSPYFMQQSQQAAGQSQFSLATPQQSQPVEETQQPSLATLQPQQATEQQQPSLATPQPAAPWDNPQRVVPQVKFPVSPQPSLATPQQQAATQAKFSVGKQSQLSLSVSKTIELMTNNGGDTFLNAFPVIKNSDIQKTLAALYFLTDKSQSEVSEITGLMDEVVNTGSRKEENILKEVFDMAIDASNGCLFDDRNGCRKTADKIKNHLKGLLAKPQSSTSPYIDPNDPF